MKDIENNIDISSEDINEEALVETNIIKNSSNENSEINKNNIDELNSTENENNNNDLNSHSSTDLIEYKEIEEPCVALTIIGENRLTNTQVFIKRGFKFSIKAFFSSIVLTIMNMFI